MLKIVKADVEHAAHLSSLSAKTFRDAFGQHNKSEDMDKYIAEQLSEAQLAGEIEHADNVFFLAWYHDRLAGYAKLRVNKEPEELKDNKPIEMERIYVLQEYHGQKIGAELMKHCIDFARTKNHGVIWLGVWEQNHKAVNFYKRFGFELFGAHPFLLGEDWQTDVLMKMEL